MNRWAQGGRGGGKRAATNKVESGQGRFPSTWPGASKGKGIGDPEEVKGNSFCSFPQKWKRAANMEREMVGGPDLARW